MAKLEIYKRNQGRYIRSITFAAAMVIGAVGLYELSEKFASYAATRVPYIQFGVPAVLVVVLGLLMFHVVNKPRFADFLIATEGEMKKVSWSSKKEVIGSTKVVIITTFMLAGILFLVDLLFVTLFDWMNIMGGAQ